MVKLGASFVKDKLGFRTRMEVVPMDASLLRGSHGRLTGPEHGPVLITRHADLLGADTLHATQVHDLILAHMTGKRMAA